MNKSFIQLARPHNVILRHYLGVEFSFRHKHKRDNQQKDGIGRVTGLRKGPRVLKLSDAR